jgi:hypothetical protein
MPLISPWARVARLVALCALLAMAGGELPYVSYVSDAGEGELYECPTCGRVERSVLDGPECSGKPPDSHESVQAGVLLVDSDQPPTDNEHLFT